MSGWWKSRIMIVLLLIRQTLKITSVSRLGPRVTALAA